MKTKRAKAKGSGRSAGPVQTQALRLEVLEVSASSGEGAGIETDTRAVKVLQGAGFVGLRKATGLSGWMSGRAEGNGLLLVLECELEPGRRKGSFKLRRYQDGRFGTDVDFGDIFCVDEHTTPIEISANGNALMTWTFKGPKLDPKRLEKGHQPPVVAPPPAPVASPSTPRVEAPPPVLKPVVSPPTKPVVEAKPPEPASSTQRKSVAQPTPPPPASVASRAVVSEAATPPTTPPPAAEKVKGPRRRIRKREANAEFDLKFLPVADQLVQHNGEIITDSDLDGQLFRVKVAEIQPLAGQPRQEFTATELKRLSQGLKQERQQQVITVTPLRGVSGKRWELVDGERRFRGALAAGVDELLALVRVFKNRQDQFWASFTSNWNRAGHTALETSDAIAQAMANGKTVAEIMVATGRTNCWVYQHLRLQLLHPDLKKLMRQSVPKANRLRFGPAYQLARVPDREKQLAIWQEASQEPTAALRRLKLEQLLQPILEVLPHKGRVRKPSDRADKVRRILRTAEADQVFLAGLSGIDRQVFLSGKETEAGIRDVFAAVNQLIVGWQTFKRQLYTAKAALKKAPTSESN